MNSTPKMSTIKLLRSRASFLLSPASSSTPVSHFSSTSNYYPSYHSDYRLQGEDSRNARVSMWWDFENCNFPAGVNVFKVASSIVEDVRANGIKGPVHIAAFGDMLHLSRANQEALSSTGVNLTHIPNGAERNFPLPTSSEKSSTTPSTDLKAKKAVKEDHHLPLHTKVVNMANRSDVDLSTSLHEKVADVTNKRDVNVASEQESRPYSSFVTVQGSSSEVGFTKIIWRKWFAANNCGLENKNHKDKKENKNCTSLDGFEKQGLLETNNASNSASGKGKSSSKSIGPAVDPVSPSSSSWSSDESALHDKVAPFEVCTGKK